MQFFTFNNLKSQCFLCMTVTPLFLEKSHMTDLNVIIKCTCLTAHCSGFIVSHKNSLAYAVFFNAVFHFQ